MIANHTKSTWREWAVLAWMLLVAVLFAKSMFQARGTTLVAAIERILPH